MTQNIPSTSNTNRIAIKRVLTDLFVVVIIAAIIAVVLFWNKTRPKEWMVTEKPAPLQIRSGTHSVRSPVGTGNYYPADKEELFNTIKHMMTLAPPIGIRDVRAILVPHAAYLYSGEVAASSFREVGTGFKRVFILAANHNNQANYSGVSIANVTHYAIPDIDIPLSAVVDDFETNPLFVSDPAAHTMYMIEIELPFLHYLRGQPEEVDFTIIPLILGRMDQSQIEQLAELLDRYANSETLFVFSVDLSHFYPEHIARQLDMNTIQSIMSRDLVAVNEVVTDGNQVLLTMLTLAQRRNWEPSFLIYRNSGNISGDRSRVVGYGSVVFSDPFFLTEVERADLLSYARQVINEYVNSGRTPDLESQLVEQYPFLKLPRGVFVTLEKEGQLRGCIGNIFPAEPLFKGVQSCAISAATKDPRFDPVTPEELNQLSLSISILDFPTPVRVEQAEDFLKVLKPLSDGVILSYQDRQSTFLPYVWRDIPDPREFLSRLCLKQGSPADC